MIMSYSALLMLAIGAIIIAFLMFSIGTFFMKRNSVVSFFFLCGAVFALGLSAACVIAFLESVSAS